MSITTRSGWWRQGRDLLTATPWGVGLALLLILAALDLPLYDVDEGAFSEATREMVSSGQYLTTTLDGEPRHDKPILFYWLQAAAIQLFDIDEVSLRLPSVVASLFWLWGFYRFSREGSDDTTAVVAALIFTQTLIVGFMMRSATADALLNLFLALTLFDIYRYYRSLDSTGRGAQRLLLRVYLWMGLGLLTKGPVAVVLPLLISALFFLQQRRMGAWLRAVISPLGWLVLLVVVAPWVGAVLLWTDGTFLSGFLQQHNIGRFTDTMEGHGGVWWYYLVALPLLMLPFTGLLLRLPMPLLNPSDSDPLTPFLWIWFGVVLLLFSFSATQLPHYLLYGLTPLILLLALHRQRLHSPLLAYLPPLTLLLLVLFLPELLQLAAQPDDLYQQELKQAIDAAFSSRERLMAVLLLLLLLGVVIVERHSQRRWQGVVLSGHLQLVALNLVLLPTVFEGYQRPIQEAAVVVGEHAVDYPGPVLRWGSSHPSFSLYMRHAVLQWSPQHQPLVPGAQLLIRVDHLDQLRRHNPDVTLETLYRRGGIALMGVGS